MSARWATDSTGKAHYLLHQEMDNSCGPACVAMVEETYKQACLIDPEGRARQISQDFPGRFQADTGTTAGNLAYVLNAIGVPCYASEFVPQARMFDYFWQYVSDRTPVIAKILWAGGGGRHFSVLKEINRTTHKMIFLDPWYDVVEINRADLPRYSAGGGANGTLEGWLTIPHR
ncbi:MAG TPA: papain-like cysteine protease family protein [Pyrinomonadaceae bacterium]|nr:papain-like cysteine protease family protein [Pyrinomonadaceae bacterium]